MPVKTDPIQIVNKRGLHARASAALARKAGTYDALITVTKNAETVHASSMLGLMMLGASQGESIILEADGHDAEEAITALTDLIENRFGEED